MASMLARFDRQVWILTIGSLVSSFGYSIAYPFISLYLYEYRGIPMADVGLALLISATFGGITQIAGGELCDRLGRRAMMIVGLVLNIAAFLLLSAAIMMGLGYREFLVLMCIREIAGGLYRNVPMVMVADVVEPGERNGAFSLLRIAGNLGFAMGPILGGLLATFSYAAMFFMTAVTSGIYLLIAVFMLRDTLPAKCERSDGGNSLEIVRNDRPFLIFCVVSAIVSLVYAQMLTTFSSYSGSFAGISESYIGVLFSLNGFMVVFFQYPIALLLERLKLTTSLMIGTVLYAIGFGIVGLSGSFWPLAGCMFIITMGELVFTPPSMNIVSRMAKPENRGRYMSLSGVLGGVGMAWGPMVGGYLMDELSSDIWLMWLIMGAIMLSCVAGFIYLRLKVPREIDSASI